MDTSGIGTPVGQWMTVSGAGESPGSDKTPNFTNSGSARPASASALAGPCFGSCHAYGRAQYRGVIPRVTMGNSSGDVPQSKNYQRFPVAFPPHIPIQIIWTHSKTLNRLDPTARACIAFWGGAPLAHC